MYTVFLVEDELLIREGVKNLVDWGRLGFEFVGEAADGELAWLAIQKKRPDIVITDIKMPFMDGLALSRLVRKELPRTTIVILSGYDDFSYAQEAISIGVSQYLLKPLSKDQLVGVLQGVRERLDGQQAQERYMQQFSREMQEYMTTSRRRLFEDLVSGDVPVSELLERARRVGVELEAEGYNLILFMLQEQLLREKYSVTIADVQEDICRVFPNIEHCVLFGVGLDTIVFLVKADAGSLDGQVALCLTHLKEICAPIEEEVKWFAVVGKPVSRLSALPSCYRAVRTLLFRRGFGQSGGVVFAQREGAPPAGGEGLDFDPGSVDAHQVDQRVIERFLENGTPGDIDAFLSGYLLDKGGFQSPIYRHYVVLNFQFTVGAFLEKLGCPPPGQGQPQALKAAMARPQAAIGYLRGLLLEALAQREGALRSRYTPTVQKALEYISGHYTDPDLGLNTMAQLVNVSATHFSAVFSQQVGKTFVEHITQLRMEKAKELLRATGRSAADIAYSVGYNDPHYFSFLFKKVNGCSPRDYRGGKGAQK